MNATQVIKDGYRRCNRLSPGETLNGDDLERGFDELEVIVDELSVKQRFLYKSVFTSAAQTGNITLGAGSWSTIAPGTEIFNVYVDNDMIDYTTPARFASISEPTSIGTPSVWTYDGFNAVSLYPQPSGETVKIQTGSSVTAFADFSTEYVLPPGYRAYLGARLAVKMHSSIAKLTQAEVSELLREESRAEMAIQELNPAIIDTCDTGTRGNIIDGWQ